MGHGRAGSTRDAMRGAMDEPGQDMWEARLSEYLDGSLPPAEARALRSHLAGCPSCREVLGDLERVRHWARTQQPLAPARDLWPEIRNAILGPGVAEPGPPEEALRPFVSSSGRSRGVYLRVPQLAAAVVALLLLGAAGGIALLRTGDGLLPAPDEPGARIVESAALSLDPVPAAGVGDPTVPELEGLAREARRLQARLEAAADRLDPVTVDVLQRNLTVIDGAIREATEALARQPDDPYVREHLVQAWERRADVLRQVADVASWQEAD